MKLLTILLILMNAVLSFAQSSPEQIEKRYPVIEHLLSNGRMDEALKMGEVNFLDSKKISFTPGIIESSLLLAFILNSRGEFDKSDAYLRIAEEENRSVKSKDVASKINERWAERYLGLGLYKKSIERYRLNLDLGDYRTGAAYSAIAICFSHINQLDSTFIYNKKAYLMFKGDKRPDILRMAAIVCVNIGLDYSSIKQVDSANLYINKGLSLAIASNQSRALEAAKKGKGILAFDAKKIDSAIYYFYEALSLARSFKDRDEIKNLYELLASAYKLNKNTAKYAEYLNLHNNFSDSLAEIKNLPYVVESITAAHEEQMNKKKKQEMMVLLGVCGLAAGAILLFTYYKVKQHKKEKSGFVKEREDLISSISKNKTEAEIEAIGILAEFARKKDPAFFLKFNELYPDFRDKLIKKFPDLSLTDIEFCSYLRMNFDTKEIAIYANMTVRSVEAKKYRLRKKMKISSTEDMNLLVIDL